MSTSGASITGSPYPASRWKFSNWRPSSRQRIGNRNPRAGAPVAASVGSPTSNSNQSARSVDAVARRWVILSSRVQRFVADKSMSLVVLARSPRRSWSANPPLTIHASGCFFASRARKRSKATIFLRRASGCPLSRLCWRSRSSKARRNAAAVLYFTSALSTSWYKS